MMVTLHSVMVTLHSEGSTLRTDEFIRVGEHPFALAKTPTTNRQWRKYMLDSGQQGLRPPDDDLPVVNVSALDAEAYCAWLSAKLGLEVRLPTEEEWLLAASPDGRLYPWGAEEPVPGVHAVFQATGPAPVGSCPKGAGPYGHLDLAGNVWEWTSSLWSPVTCSYRVVRGGGWYNTGAGLRVSHRFRNEPGVRGDLLGFRCARSFPHRQNLFNSNYGFTSEEVYVQMQRTHGTRLERVAAGLASDPYELARLDTPGELFAKLHAVDLAKVDDALRVQVQHSDAFDLGLRDTT